MEHITLEISKNRVTQIILLDLEKAFDSVWQSALLVKLQKNKYSISSPHTDN